MKSKIAFIVNPFSGNSSKRTIPEMIAKLLDSEKYDYQIIYTEYAGHAIEIARNCVEDNEIDIVVAVGGDGSVNEVAASLADTNKILGIVPAGSGNGLAMHLGLGRQTSRAISLLNDSKVVEIDTCTVNQKFFINVAGLGFDARVAYLTKANKKRGFLPYFTTSLQEFKNFKPISLTINIDGKIIRGSYAAAVVANASLYGYHFSISPHSSLQDGLLDVVLIKEAPVYKYLLSGWRFLNRSLHRSSLVEIYKGKDVTIESESKDYLHLDGEGFESESNLTFTIAPNSLKVLVPANSKQKWKL